MKKLRLAVLISGTGRSLKNLIGRINEGTLSAEIVLVVANTPLAQGLQYAEKSQIPIEVFERGSFDSLAAFSRSIFQVCRQAKVDYVVMAGFFVRLELEPDFEGKVLNIHPSLVPAFCGKGFYGLRVHTAVLEYGAKITGCSVHFVDNYYDNGPVILQKAVDVLDDDTPVTLSDRVFTMECVAYPEAIQLIAEGKVSVEGRRVRIKK